MTDQEPPHIASPRVGAIKWRWYHFYFLLALFDLGVIVASLALYHGTLTSYKQALRKIATIQGKQRWVGNLRLAVIYLNAPGNDVFETRRVSEERGRFERAEDKLRLLMSRGRKFGEGLSSFRGDIDKMIAEEKKIFDYFTVAGGTGSPGRIDHATLEAAATAMAAMDRHQAAAMSTLSGLQQRYSMRESGLLREYGDQLARNAALEKYFLATVVLILIGVFWYGRKLQRMHERMIVDQQQAMAERHGRLASVGEVCSAVAHGIRNPLAAISSSAQLVIHYGTLDEQTKLRVQDILAECQRLNDRVTRLLNFSAVSARVSERYELREAIEQAIEEVNIKLDERNLHVTREFEGVAMTVEGDRDGMVQSVIEILSNAMEHVPAGGHIQIACRRVGDQRRRVQVDIVDDGPGIPSNVRDQVFDLFFTSKDRGTGIGLASVKRAVEFHRGEVSVVPDNGTGAHFRIILPLAQPLSLLIGSRAREHG